MRIVHLYKDYYPPVVGGIEMTVRRMARGALAAGAEVTVLCSAHGSRRDRDEVVEGVRVIRCAEWARVASTPLCPGMPGRLARLEADIHHLHFPSPPGEVSWLLARRRSRMVVTYHSDVVRQAAVLPVYGPVIRAVLARARVVMPTSPQYLERSRWLREVRARCRVVPLGIELDAVDRLERLDGRAAGLRARYGTPLAAFVGRFRYYKGLDVLLRAMRGAPGHAVLVGGGPLEPELRRLAAGLGLEGRVHFAGSVEEEERLAHLRAADVLVMPSTQPAEAFGLSLVEALAAGIPAISTELGTGTSFVNEHGVTGLVVPPGDPEALAAALARLFGDEPLRRAMGEAGRRRARERFSAERMNAEVMRVYEEVLRA